MIHDSYHIMTVVDMCASDVGSEVVQTMYANMDSVKICQYVEHPRTPL